MRYATTIALSALTALVALSGNAFAGIITTKVPEPGTLALLAVGFGALGAVRYFRGK